MAKRGNGEGTFSLRPDGRWHGQLRVADPVTGEVRRLSVYARTKPEARAKLRAKAEEVAGGAPTRDSDVTVAEWVERWIAGPLAASVRRATTQEVYARVARVHLSPAPFGAKRVGKVLPADVERLLVVKAEAGYEPATVRMVYQVLRAVLDSAKRNNLCRSNVVLEVARPTVPSKEAVALRPEDAGRLVAGLREDPMLFALVLLMLLTGMRRGEALALAWSDVHFEERGIFVRQTLSRSNLDGLQLRAPKTRKSRRWIPLSAEAMEVLKVRRVRQLEERLAAGEHWSDSGLVFTAWWGTPWEPRNAQVRFARVAAASGMPAGTRLHTLRHSAASILLAAGVPMKVVQELLGHSAFSTTADLYSHVPVEMATEAVDALGAALRPMLDGLR
jgi:integrase